MASLVEQAEAFARTLTSIVNGTLAVDAAFTVTPTEDGSHAWVFPHGSTPTSPRTIAVTCDVTPGEQPKLWLRANYFTRLDSSGDHLAVETSVFALAITEAGRPAIRIEYDRDQGGEPDDGRPGVHRRSAAHVQIHGASEEIAYALAVSGQPLRRLEQFHIPVGGRRFRPSLEDFIEFLHGERLIRLYDGWQSVIVEHRSEWLRRQTRATVRNDPANAAAQLIEMGYRVAAPDSSP